MRYKYLKKKKKEQEKSNFAFVLWRIFQQFWFPLNVSISFATYGICRYKFKGKKRIYRCRKTSILWRQLQEIFSIILDLPSISPQNVIFGFQDDALEHKLLLNHILLNFRNYLYKASENRYLNFNILKHYLTKISDLEANLRQW